MKIIRLVEEKGWSLGYRKLLSAAQAGKCSHHAGFPHYEETPLVSLSSLARTLGISGLYVKDESKRFGLNAFKALAGPSRSLLSGRSNSSDTVDYEKFPRRRPSRFKRFDLCRRPVAAMDAACPGHKRL